MGIIGIEFQEESSIIKAAILRYASIFKYRYNDVVTGGQHYSDAIRIILDHCLPQEHLALYLLCICVPCYEVWYV